MAPDDLPPISPDIERLLSAERVAPGPSPEMMSRIAARLDTSLASSAGAGATATSVKAASSTVGGLSAIQWVTAALVSAGLVTAGWVALTPPKGEATSSGPRAGNPTTATRPGPIAAPASAPSSATAPATPTPVSSSMVEPVAVEPVAAEPVAAEPVASEPVAAEPVAGAAPASVAMPLPSDPGVSRAFERLPIETAAVAATESPTRLTKRASASVDLEGERKLRQARNALRAGDVRTTLTLLNEHRKSHPRGALVEEREALRILALAARGDRASALDAAVRFRARFKKSVHDGAIRAALGE